MSISGAFFLELTMSFQGKIYFNMLIFVELGAGAENVDRLDPGRISRVLIIFRVA